jgi:hypothetical protein
MKRAFAALLAVACILGPTTSFARGGGFGHGAGVGHGFSTRGALRRDPTLLGNTPPSIQRYQSRIPAPFSSPAQPPIINGPCSSGSCM